MCEKYGRVHGIYYGFEQVLTIAEPELIKQIWVKDFNKLVNTRYFRTYHELINNIMFMGTEDEQWRRLRRITSPCFSSGRLHAMCASMDRSGDRLVSYLGKLNSGTIEDVRQVMIGFTLDVIASNVFGIETESNQDDFAQRTVEQNQFLKNAARLFQLSPFR